MSSHDSTMGSWAKNSQKIIEATRDRENELLEAARRALAWLEVISKEAANPLECEAAAQPLRAAIARY